MDFNLAISQSIPELLAVQAQRNPHAEVIGAPDRLWLTYDQLYRQVQAVVERLNALGLGRGDRVAIVLPNGPEMAVAFLAVASGTASAPLNPAYGEAEFDFYLTDLNARAVLLLAESDSPARETAFRIASLLSTSRK